MAQYLLHTKDKAAFLNSTNKRLKQINPETELDINSFIVVPGSGEDDKCIYVSADPTEQDMIDTMIDNKVYNFKVKKIDLKEIVKSLKSQA
jgi:hypothetical protein